MGIEVVLNANNRKCKYKAMNEYTGKNDTSVHNAVDSLINSCNQDLMYENVLGQEGGANGSSE